MKKEKKWYQSWWAIILYVLIVFWAVSQFYHYTGFDPANRVRLDLEEEGYEVIDVMYLDMTDTGHLEMKSLGNREEQVWDGMMALAFAYPNASQYAIWIYTPTQTCFYSTMFTNLPSLMKAWRGERISVNEDYVLDGVILPKMVESYNEENDFPIYIEDYTNISSTDLYALTKYELMLYPNCE